MLFIDVFKTSCLKHTNPASVRANRILVAKILKDEQNLPAEISNN